MAREDRSFTYYCSVCGAELNSEEEMLTRLCLEHMGSVEEDWKEMDELSEEESKKDVSLADFVGADELAERSDRVRALDSTWENMSEAKRDVLAKLASNYGVTDHRLILEAYLKAKKAAGPAGPVMSRMRDFLREAALVGEVTKPEKAEKTELVRDEAQESKKDERALAPADFVELDKRDEAQMLREMSGEVLSELVYDFKQGSRHVVGISYAGIKQLAFGGKFGSVRILNLSIEELPEKYRAVAKARNDATGVEMFGVAEQPKVQPWDGKPDPFAYTKAASKAQRNAMRAVIPETAILELVKAYMEKRGKGGK